MKKPECAVPTELCTGQVHVNPLLLSAVEL